MNPGSTVKLYTGREMPVLGLGTWELTNDTGPVIAHALELGYRMIDTASDYGTQPGIAEGVRLAAADREEWYLVAKVEETDDAYRATRDYLAELEQDYADLMLIHRPPAKGVGEALWEGLLRAKQEKLAHDIGVSNYSFDQMQALARASGEQPAVNQVEWSPFGWSAGMLEQCREEGIVIQAYSPLTRATRLDDAALVDVARNHDKSPAQVLIRWNLQRGVVPLPKANRLDHLEENIDVFDFELGEEDMEKLDALNEQYSSLGTLPYL
jgi:2,5-diketo-D-gluconate reductase A